MIEIREERPGDLEMIRDVNIRAFGRDHEAGIVDRLRSSGAVSLSLVAIQAGKVVGHILYSPACVGDVAGAGLAPLAVAPEHQRQGIGSALITHGHQQLKNPGCPFVVVLGHPSFYPRFGFRPASRYGISCEWDVRDESFMVAVLNESQMRGVSGAAKYRAEFTVGS